MNTLSKPQKKSLKSEKKRLKQAQWVASETQYAQELYAEKSFAQEWWELKYTAMFIVFVCSPISILTGIGYPYYNLINSFGEIGAFTLSSIGLLIIELLKGILTWRCFILFYKDGLTSRMAVVGIASLLFVVGSVYTSLLGTEELYLHFDNKQAHIDKTHKDSSDSLQKVYQKQIATEKEGLEAFTKRVTWEGKVNIYDPVVRSTISRYEARIDSLQAERRNLLKSTGEAHRHLRKENAKRMGYNLTVIISLSAFIEALLIVSQWFLAWYAYQILSEKQGNIGEEATLLEQATNYIYNLLPTLLQGRFAPLQNMALQDTQHSKQDLQEVLQEENSGFTRKIGFNVPDYAGLCKAVAEGNLHTPTLTNTFNVNINAVSACKLLHGHTIKNPSKIKHTAEYEKIQRILNKEPPRDLFTL